MLTKIGRELWLSNAGSNVLPSLYLNKGHTPWRTISSSDNKYFGDYVVNHSLSTRVSSINNTSTNGIAFGNGTTPASEDDYTMENLVSAGTVQFLSAVVAYDETNNKVYTYVNINITNSTSDDITISELGLFVTARASNTPGSDVDNNNNYTVMVDHTILDAPITIAPSEVGIIQYRFEIDE